MNYKTAIEIFDKLDSDDKAKEIYAHFGLAVYFAQVLEQKAINMITFCRKTKSNMTNQEQIDALWNDYDLGSRTFGVLINEIKQLYSLSDKDGKELTDVLKLRNYIAHDYFRFNTELFYSDSGQKRMIKDFIEFQERANSLDNILQQYLKVFCIELGLTDERIDTILEQTKKEWEKKIITDEHKTIIK
jgi:hypothetical protein